MYRNVNYQNNGDRFLCFPFLVGALAGGAVVGLSRPRYPYPYPYPVPYQYPQQYPQQYGGYPNSYNSSTSYSYYN